MGWVDDFQRRLQAGIAEGIEQIAEDIVEAAKPIISKEAIDRGDLLKSGEARRLDAITAQAVWTAEHAPYVEYGTRPHWPPPGPIREWVKRNIRIETPAGPKGPQPGRAVVKPRTKRGTRDPREEEIDRLTFLIQRKIAMKGTEPVRFATRAARRVAPSAGDTLSRAIVRHVQGTRPDRNPGGT